MQRVLIILFFVGFVIVWDAFSMNSSSYYISEEYPYSASEEDVCAVSPKERLKLINYVEKCFSKMELIIEFFGQNYVEEFLIYSLWGRKKSFLKKSWKKFIYNMSNELAFSLKKEVEKLKEEINTRSFCVFLSSRGITVKKIIPYYEAF